MAVLISVVLPCRNEAAHIRRCVESLLKQQRVPGDFEIIVVDGRSEDGTRAILDEMARQNSRLRVIDNAQRITPCGMNTGVRAARGEWIAIMGCHARYASDYLVCCWETALKTGADNVGGRMLCEWDGPTQRAIAAAHHSSFSVGGARWHDANYEGWTDTVFGGFYRREVFDRIGFFDEQLVRNQDDEFNLRLTRAGGRIWHSPLIRSWYQPRASLAALFRQYTQYGYWKVRVIQKHKLPAAWRHLVPGVFVLTVLTLSGLSMVGLALAPFWREASYGGWFCASVGAAVLTVYLMACVLASFSAAAKHGWPTLPLLPVVFVCYHWGYGYGFLRGLWDFVLRGKAPSAQFRQITRPKAGQEAC